MNNSVIRGSVIFRFLCIDLYLVCMTDISWKSARTIDSSVYAIRKHTCCMYIYAEPCPAYQYMYNVLVNCTQWLPIRLQQYIATQAFLLVTIIMIINRVGQLWVIHCNFFNIGLNDLGLEQLVTSVLSSNTAKNEARIFRSFILYHAIVNRWDGQTPHMTHFISPA